MKKYQRLILILFAIVDMIIIAFLARTVYKTSISYSEVGGYSPELNCASVLLDALNADHRQVIFSQHDGVIYLTISHTAVATIVEQDEVELLWSLLDQLAYSMPEAYDLCQEPESIVIQLDVLKNNTTKNHAAIIQVNDLIRWSKNEIDNHTLAANIKYRQVTVPSD
jgi:hypothetical protein